jgi:DNA-binding CsgD family transcriptional regulator
MPYELIFDQLLATFPATGVSYNWSDPNGVSGVITRPSKVLKQYEEVVQAWQRGELLLQHPLATWHVVSGDIRPTTSSRVPSAIVPARDRSIVDTALREVGAEEQLSITYRLSGYAYRAFVLGRSGSDFTDDDLVVACQIQRLLIGLDRQLSMIDKTRLASPCAYADVGLTARELAVIELVAAGRTTRAIAHQLCCSPRTVNKHLEHAYRKLGVRDRINAVRVVSSWGQNAAEGQSTAGDPHRPRLEPNPAPAG